MNMYAIFVSYYISIYNLQGTSQYIVRFKKTSYPNRVLTIKTYKNGNLKNKQTIESTI